MASPDVVRWLNDREMRAWRAYIETFADLNAALEADLARHDMTVGDYQVLVYLSDADTNRMRMCDLAERLQLSPSGLTRRLDGLVRSGLVAREPFDDDRRVMMAVLTPKGRSTLKRVAPHHVDSVRHHIIDLLTEEQLEAMADIFTAVRAGLLRKHP